MKFIDIDSYMIVRQMYPITKLLMFNQPKLLHELLTRRAHIALLRIQHLLKTSYLLYHCITLYPKSPLKQLKPAFKRLAQWAKFEEISQNKLETEEDLLVSLCVFDAVGPLCRCPKISFDFWMTY